MPTADPSKKPEVPGEAPVNRAPGRRPARAPMRSFFWRIFMWFWLAMLLLSTAVTVTVYFADPDQFFPRWRAVPLRRIDRLANGSIAAYEQGGSGALRGYLNHRSAVPSAEHDPTETESAHSYLFEADHLKELSGQKMPGDLSGLVTRTRDKGDVQLQRLLSQLLFARSYVSQETGRRYVFVTAEPRPSLLLPTRFRGWLPLSAALATSALVCYWLARYVIGPVRRLQAAARRLAGGDLTVRVATDSALANRRDEFGELAADFDDMAVRIADLLAAQRRLIADISHELGSPLTRVNVALGLASRKARDEVQPELDRIQREANRLNDLIRQLLMISELENGSPSEPFQTLDLSALVRDVAADAAFEAGSRHCQVRVTGDGTTRPVQGIRHLLRSAVENVVRNAVRYTAEASEILIEIDGEAPRSTAHPHAVVRVRDHGPGVPEAALEDLFRPFYRVSEARDRQSGGTGLGLAITRQAVDIHGGTVKAVNQPGGGLMVEIALKA